MQLRFEKRVECVALQHDNRPESTDPIEVLQTNGTGAGFHCGVLADLGIRLGCVSWHRELHCIFLQIGVELDARQPPRRRRSRLPKSRSAGIIWQRLATSESAPGARSSACPRCPRRPASPRIHFVHPASCCRSRSGRTVAPCCSSCPGRRSARCSTWECRLPTDVPKSEPSSRPAFGSALTIPWSAVWCAVPQWRQCRPRCHLWRRYGRPGLHRRSSL